MYPLGARPLNSACWVIFACFLSSADMLSKNTLECQTIWVQIRGLIWVQTVVDYKGTIQFISKNKVGACFINLLVTSAA